MLYCTFYGGGWGGEFFRVEVEGRGGLLSTVCGPCRGRPVDELRAAVAEGLASPDRLHCTFCGGEWDSGLFFSVPTREDPARKVPFACCLMCNATRTDQELRGQLHANAP